MRRDRGRFRNYEPTSDINGSTSPDLVEEKQDYESVVYGRVKGSVYVNVRAAPNKDSEILAKLDRFAPVRINSDDGDYYCVTIPPSEVHMASLTGFVLKEYCEVV